MSVMESRGGRPHVFIAAISTTGRVHDWRQDSKWLRIRVTTNPCKVYFTEADFTNDANYITVQPDAVESPNMGWEGPLEVRQVWLKSTTGSSNVELVATLRRG